MVLALPCPSRRRQQQSTAAKASRNGARTVEQVHVKWRLDSRKSFKLNKDITRNNTILKWKAEGKDWESWLPDHLKPEKPAAAGGAAAEAQAEPDIEKKIAAVTVSD